MLTEFLEIRKNFQHANPRNKLLWYTSIVTGNFRNTGFDGRRKKISFRPLLGFLRYCLFDLPLSAGEPPRDVQLVFATVFLLRQGRIGEAFFGILPALLNKDGIKTASVGKVAYSFSRKLERQAHEEAGAYCPTRLLSKWDGLKCVFKALRGWLSIKYPAGYRDRISKEIFQSFTSEVLVGLLYETMLRKVIAANPGAKIIHPLEGNIWEAACQYVGAKKVFGYQHAAILNDQIKISAFTNRPLPAQVITTGKKAANALLQFEYSPRHLIEGYSLRQSAIYDHQHKTQPPRIVSRVLVLMQGNEDANGVLDTLRTINALYKDKIILTLRPHPAVPLQMMGVTDRDGFDISVEQDIYKDILAHDVCAYVSAAAAFDAIYLGVPVVHIKAQGTVDSDPLFACPYLKASAQTVQEIFEKAKLFADYPEYDEELKQARAYYDGYFNRPDERMKDQFKTWLDLS